MSLYLNYEFKDVEASLNCLKGLLGKHEYKAGYYQRLAEGFGFIHAPRQRLNHGDPTTELLLSFFAENRSLKLKEIKALFTEELQQELERNRLIVRTDKGEFLSVFRIFPLNHFFILVPFRRFTEPQVYLGAESLTFHKYIQVIKHPKKILDLASGSGFQLFGLPWQGPNVSMLGIDLNPNAVTAATLTAEWNNTSQWMTFKEGDITTDLYDFSEQFDLITGHLPILPTPDNTRYKDTVHNDGGVDGFKVVRKVFPAIPDILDPDGTFQLILILLGDEQKPSLFSEIEQIMKMNGLKGQLLAIKKLPVELDAYYRGKKEFEYKKWMNFYINQGSTYWYRNILRVKKYSQSDKDIDRLTFIKLFRTDFSKPPKAIALKAVLRSMGHYLSDLASISDLDREEFEMISDRLAKEIIQERNLQKSVTEYGKELAANFPEIFPNSGSAIRFWGQLTSSFWQPKYLERKLW
ncbi:hypothetical protein CEE45_15295 [Candidatus Heimdallarchaeota archaeon B3_Heim]|nr:MAG: hypothetical protein CEE45_15295 [Candidatus Heimdallarchaeota archaeon B3_Heim]